MPNRRDRRQSLVVTKSLRRTRNTTSVKKLQVRIAKEKRKQNSEILENFISNRRQSPIDIKSDVICYDPDNCKPDSLNISYTIGDCHEVICTTTGFRVNVGVNCCTTLKASHLPGTYELTQFHAHWSNDGSVGSEHLLDGKAMSGEVHFVFWNTKYASLTVAAEQEDGLAVVGVFLNEGEHSVGYAPLFDAIEKAIDSAGPIPMPRDFILEQLLPPPDQRDYITYLGSLTTPPYSETVIWTVLTTPVEVSRDQMDILRKIVSSNYRECQELYDREVRASPNAKV
ncbi:carbonate dehydratase, eukaryotic-type [Dictyocaulus viviparus]|uniref:Carbonate dehydratase, eukaryotic-type n=1 Tax=Dictyocaulus viviparus TaxID=29172 RepID=A0A0D8XWA5_DICVI|nr:carbonate dehydratase, eukaryotic-type [Dictyocaulus viviparus]